MKPVLQALVVAEHVYQDVSGKKIIAGTFDRIHFKKAMPRLVADVSDGSQRPVLIGGMQGGAPYAYINLTDICDGTSITIQFVNLTKNQVLFGTTLVAKGSNRLGMSEIVAPLPHLPIDESGTYAIEVLCEGEILGSYRIIAEELPDLESGE